jgi:hypothetical protein
MRLPHVQPQHRDREGHDDGTGDQSGQTHDLQASEQSDEYQQGRHALIAYQSRSDHVVAESDHDQGTPAELKNRARGMIYGE